MQAEFECGVSGSRTLAIVHLDCIARAAHLISVSDHHLYLRNCISLILLMFIAPTLLTAMLITIVTNFYIKQNK